MSATIELRTDQIEAVITESLARGFFETGPEGQLPDEDGLRKAAVDLVRQATLSHAAGNESDGVLALLHIAEVMSDSVSTSPPEGETMAASDAEQLAGQPDEMLPKLLTTLSNFDQNDPNVVANLNLIKAEMAKRGLSVPADVVADQPPVAAPAETVQEATTGPTRQELEDRLTFPMMRAHQIDPSEIGSLTDAELLWVIEHPAGGEEAPAPQVEPVVATAQEETVKEDEPIQTTRMVVETPPEPAPPVPQASAPSESVISAEREELESQITGPILKVYGRGRKDIPEIGDAELGFMIANPDGRVSLEALEAAKALDRGESVPTNDLESGNDDDAQPTIAAQKREAKAETPPAATQEVHSPASESAFAPAAQAAVEAAASEVPTHAPSSASPAPAPVAVPSAPPVASGRVTQASALRRETPENPAQAIIDKENFPVASEIEEAPRLPFDLSQCSDDEIRSYHSRFHSCLARANVVVSLWESEYSDAIKLRKKREVDVANNLPTKDGRTKVTDAQREAMVQADADVLRYRDEEHDIEKVLRQLKTLRDNYSRDVSTCSRQLGRREDERQSAR